MTFLWSKSESLKYNYIPHICPLTFPKKKLDKDSLERRGRESNRGKIAGPRLMQIGTDTKRSENLVWFAQPFRFSLTWI